MNKNSYTRLTPIKCALGSSIILPICSALIANYLKLKLPIWILMSPGIFLQDIFIKPDSKYNFEIMITLMVFSSAFSGFLIGYLIGFSIKRIKANFNLENKSQ